MPNLSDAGTLTARVLTSLIFVGAGLTQATDPHEPLHMITHRGLPLAHVLYVASTAVLLGGALSLLVGWRTRWGSIALLLFIVPATFLFHLHSDQADIELFTRDLAIAGGLILLIQHGPGRLSLDARAQRRRLTLPEPGTRSAAVAATGGATAQPWRDAPAVEAALVPARRDTVGAGHQGA
ncbi:DoxX family protein [Streptacidiphilus pinicola]|nr:DoxX family protein [Streptacidiphilus pinicola]